MAAIDCTNSAVEAALWLARAFANERRLAVWAPDAPDHGHHVAVEFLHPVVAGTIPLPAVVIDDLGQVSADDVVLSIGTGAPPERAELVIRAEQGDVGIVRSYHLLWELAHVALNHPGLVGATATVAGDSTGFLYPFLDAAERDGAWLNQALAASADAKVAESSGLVEATIESNASAVGAAGLAIGEVVRAGGRIYTMGNGGSACDAARLARLLGALGAHATMLANDYAVVTALANDVGAGSIFSRQLEAVARAGDLLIGCSTSGESRNLLAGFKVAERIGVSSIGICGYGGVGFASEPTIAITLSVASTSVHRIQEAQAALIAELCDAVAGHIGSSREPAS